MSDIADDSSQRRSNEVKNKVENQQASQKPPHSAVIMGKDNEGYGSAGKAEACSRASPYHRQGFPSSSVADGVSSNINNFNSITAPQATQNTTWSILEGASQKDQDCNAYADKHCWQSLFSTTQVKERNFESAMCEIRRNYETKDQVDLQEVLQSRARIYGTQLDPKLFCHGSDLGDKVKSVRENNMARAMLVGGPLMLAQTGAQMLRKRMIQGDSRILQNLVLDAPTTLAKVLKQLENVPPLALLKLFNTEVGNFVVENLLQHSDDLDFIQDVLDVTGSYCELTPTLHAVLAGFNRRKNFGSFKHGHQSILMDRLRFSHLASAHQQKCGNDDRSKKAKKSIGSGICNYYQRSAGCKNGDECRFEHTCIICGAQAHGAISCKMREQVHMLKKASKGFSSSKRDNQRSR